MNSDFINDNTMKIIIKLTIFVFLITMTFESFAQTFGIKAGLNLSNMLIKETEFFIPYNNNSYNYKMNPGFHLGATAELPVSDLFTLETGLLFSVKGIIISNEENFGATPLITKEKQNLLYLDIPIVAKVPFSLGGYDFYGSFGPYFGMGLAGNSKAIVNFGDLHETESRSINWGSDEGIDDFKRVDYGLTFGAGIKLNSFQAGLSYNLGLANISPESSSGSVISNRVLGISIGYMFGESKKPESAKQKTVKGEASAARSGGRKAAQLEAERLRMERIMADSIVAARAEQERIRIAKARSDSIETARVMADKLANERIARIKADSISAAKKVAALNATKDVVVYRVQFASNATKKGSYNITIGGKNYRTWEYYYKGAYRSTVGEFKTFAAAMEFQKKVKQSGHPQTFVGAFKNNVRSTDPALFK